MTLRAKPVYVPVREEQVVGAARETLWRATIDALAERAAIGRHERHIGRWTLVEDTRSVEPPWRWVSEVVEGAPAPFQLNTVAIVERHVPGECIVVCSAIVQQTGEQPPPDYIDAVRADLATLASRIVAAP